MERFGRLGNNLFQLLNAVDYALATGRNCIHISNIPLLPDTFFVRGTRILNFPLQVDLPLPSHPQSLPVSRGHFFFRDEYPELPGLGPSEETFSSLRARLLTNETSRPPLDQLTIHLRGGDVFRSKPNSEYGQPPIGFYESAINHREWSNIMVVSEDPDPFLRKPLARIAQKAQLSLSFESRSPTEDFLALVQSANLCIGVGHFAWAAVELASNLENVYFFENESRIATSQPKAVRWKVEDKSGEYIRRAMSANWTASRPQLALMKNYRGARFISEPLKVVG